MTRSRDSDALLSAYLAEGMEVLPDRVVDAVLDEVHRIDQRVPRGPWRTPSMLKFALGAAAVIAVVVLGGAVWLGASRPGDSIGAPSGPGTSSSPSTPPSPTAAPTATGATNLVEVPQAGDLAAGDYYLDLPAYPARIDFAVPAGWWHFYDAGSGEDSTVHAILVHSEDTGAANGSAWGLSFTVVDDVRVDPCHPSAGIMDPSVTESAEALADAFSSWDDFPATGVEDVTLGGFPGKRVEMTRVESATCKGTLFVTPSGFQFEMELPSSEPIVNQFTFLDVQGSVLVIWTTDFPGTTLFEVAGGASPDPQAHVADQGQLHDILESIVIQPR